MEDRITESGIYWVQFSMGREKWSNPTLRFCFLGTQLRHARVTSSAPVNIGECLKRRPSKPGWYVVKEHSGGVRPVFLASAEGIGLVMFEESQHDYWGVYFDKARPLSWLETRWRATWFGPFFPPEEDKA